MLRLLEDHLADMHAESPPESVHALDVAGLHAGEPRDRNAALSVYLTRELAAPTPD